MPDKQKDDAPQMSEEQSSSLVETMEPATRAEAKAMDELVAMEAAKRRLEAEIASKRMEAAQIDPNDPRLGMVEEKRERLDETIPGGVYIVKDVDERGKVLGARLVNANGEPVNPKALPR